MSTAIERRRHALMIVTQLPEDLDEALAVLTEARRIVEKLWSDDAPAPPRVVRFPGSGDPPAAA